MSNAIEINKIEKYVTDFERYSFIKCSIGNSGIWSLLAIILISSAFNMIAIIFYRTPLNIAVAFLSIICILISIFCYRKKGYYWFLYKFNNTAILELGFMNFIVSIECEDITKKGILLVVCFLAVCILMIELSVKKTNNIINTIYEDAKKKSNSNNTNPNILRFACLGAALGLILSNAFPEIVVPFTLLVATIFCFLMTPFMLVFYYAKKNKLSEDLLLRVDHESNDDRRKS